MPTNSVSQDVSRTQTPQSSQTSGSGAIEHARLIQSYHDYANGGAAREDARLAEEAKKLALEEEQKRRDDQTFEDLFGEVNIAASADMATRTTVERVPDGKGGWREKRTEYFQPGAPKPKPKPKDQELSLIDL